MHLAYYLLHNLHSLDILRLKTGLIQNVFPADKACLCSHITVIRKAIQRSVKIAGVNVSLHRPISFRCINFYILRNIIQLASLPGFSDTADTHEDIQLFPAGQHQIQLISISPPLNNLQLHLGIGFLGTPFIHCILYLLQTGGGSVGTRPYHKDFRHFSVL